MKNGCPALATGSLKHIGLVDVESATAVSGKAQRTTAGLAPDCLQRTVRLQIPYGRFYAQCSASEPGSHWQAVHAVGIKAAVT